VLVVLAKLIYGARVGHKARTPSLSEIMRLATRARCPRLKLHLSLRDEAAYGARFPADLRELVALADAGQARELDEFTTLSFWWGRRFLVGGPRAAATTLKQSFDEGVFYALYLRCHMTGLFPLAYTGTSYYGHMVFVEGSRGGRTPVYEFDMHSDALGWTYPSLWSLLRDAASRSGLLPALGDADQDQRRQQKPEGLPVAEDPVALWRRSRWLADALSNVLEHLQRVMALSVVDSDFAAELPLLSRRPSLAFFWLAAHALLGHGDGFERAYQATRRSPSPLVQSLRDGLHQWLARGETGGLPGLDTAATATIVDTVRKLAPRELRRALAG